jgi:hypothetical protein
MRAWFHAVTAVDAGIARPYALGGGIAARPDEPSEDCFGWDQQSGLLVSAAGIGHADGHIETYLDAAPLSRAFVDGAIASVAATALFDIVHAGVRAMKMVVERPPWHRFLGTAIEVAILRFQPDGRVEVAQQGAQALYRRRAGGTERVIRLGTLGDEYGPQRYAGSDGAVCRLILNNGDGLQELATPTLDWQPGDRFLLTTRGVHPYVDEATIDGCLGLDPDAILPALLTEVRRAAQRRKQASAAALIVEGGA